MGSSGARLAVFAVLLATMITVLLGRTVQLQATGAATVAQAAEGNRSRTLADPSARGIILDQAGRPLAANRQKLQIVADLGVLYDLPGDGAEVVSRVAGVLGTTFEDLDARLTLCESPQAVPGTCWDGAVGEPIPLISEATMEQALPFLEQADTYPGISVRTLTARSYPATAGERAGHLLGHLGAVTEEEVAEGYDPRDQVGRGGLEEQYDEQLRGSEGSRTVLVDTAGRITHTLASSPAVNGATVVTSLDAALQSVVEQQLAAAVERARSGSAGGLAADSGAAVVVDVTDGRVLAMASYPDYAPTVWDGGISEADYRGLADAGALLFNPVQGTYAPGSTYKVFTVAGMAAAGYDITGSYPCPSSYVAGGRAFANHESHAFGTITLRRALEVSCNTVFYNVADQIWQRTGGQESGPQTDDPLSAAARDFGLGSLTGIDLPGEAAGVVDGRAEKRTQWQRLRDTWCTGAATGYPELRQTNPTLADEYTALDQENCDSGGMWRQGDALNASIGQGLTAVTPLQVAMAYAAIANGGTRYRAQLAKAVIDADGTVHRHDPHVIGRVSASPSTLQFLTDSMTGVTREGTASQAFAGFPLDQVPVAGKTGSAQVAGGKPATSWFASFAPADDPRYAVVMMVTQGGTGAGTSAPSVRGIYEALFGVQGGTVDPSRSVLTGGAPMVDLPPMPGTEQAAGGGR